MAMSKVYVLFTRKYPKEGGSYTYLPGYEVHYEKPDTTGPRDKVAVLDIGECVDTMLCTLSDDEEYVNCQLVTVGNVDGKATETVTERFILARD
jgi:hypothetical protein